MFLEYYLGEFDHEMQATRTLLVRVPDASADWRPHPRSSSVGTLAQHITNLVGFGAHTIFSMPRAAVLRTYLLNHVIHHRGQLSVHLRLLNVPLPSIYGPTADEAR